jgi:UDP-glucose 4-epimerase
MDVTGKYTEVLIRWMERIDAGQPPLIFGDGRQTMDLIHVGDVARANILAATAPVSDVALNVGTETETSLLELAASLASVMGRDDLVPEHRPERAVNPVSRRLADTAAARRLLGFEAELSLEAGLRSLVDWWRRDRDRIETTRELAAVR